MRVEILVALIAAVASVGAAYITATKAAATTARDTARTEARDIVSETTGRIVERIEQLKTLAHANGRRKRPCRQEI
jgi:hypothetical protein